MRPPQPRASRLLHFPIKCTQDQPRSSLSLRAQDHHCPSVRRYQPRLHHARIPSTIHRLSRRVQVVPTWLTSFSSHSKAISAFIVLANITIHWEVPERPTTLPPMVLCKHNKCSHPQHISNNNNSNNLLKDLPTKSTGSRAFPRCPTVLHRLPFITFRNSHLRRREPHSVQQLIRR